MMPAPPKARRKGELMSDFYGDMERLLVGEGREELKAQFRTISQRRGLPVGDLVLEALWGFVEKDWLNPKGPETDFNLMFPMGEENAVFKEELPIHRTLEGLRLRDPDECPDEEIEEWLRLIGEDTPLLRQALKSKEGEAVEEDLYWTTRVRTVLSKYRGIEERLQRRLEARGPKQV